MKKKPSVKRILKIVAIALIPAYIAVFLIFIFPGAGSGDKQEAPGAPVVIDLWHVDVFEGGVGSRASFLAGRAREYEKKFKNVFFSVRSMTVEQLRTALGEGQTPDLVSYGPGLAAELLPVLEGFNGSYSAYDNFITSGAVEKLSVGVPWCAGGYVVAAANSLLADVNADFSDILASSAKAKKSGMYYSFTTGMSAYNNPLLAAYCANPNLALTEYSYNTEKARTPQEAYTSFASRGDCVFLLGTQRDAARIGARDDSGEFTVQALPGYTDLVCYISIAKDCGVRTQATGFIEYLMSEAAQRKLTNIGMLSTAFKGLYIGDDQKALRDLEASLMDAAVPNAFTAADILADQRDNALLALKGDAQAKNRLDMFLPVDLDTGLFE